MSDVVGNNVIAGKRRTASGTAASVSPDLVRRVVSSLVMIGGAVLSTFAGPVAFGLLVLAVALVLSWEWGRLVRRSGVDAAFLIHAGAISVSVVAMLAGQPFLALFALAAGMIVLASGLLGSHPQLSALGVFYAGGAALAMMAFRADAQHGLAAVLFLFVSVWTNDIMAFVFGKAIGGAKLYPSISPNKTWAGFIGGVASAGMAGFCFALVLPEADPARLALIGLALGAVAVGGDLMESALKRHFGVKDASRLIPGHGGVMDRMDGIVAVALVAVAFAGVSGGRSVASALLIGS